MDPDLSLKIEKKKITTLVIGVILGFAIGALTFCEITPFFTI